MDYPDIEQIGANRRRLGDLVRETPIWRWQGLDVDAIVGDETAVFLKLELFQHTGSFKPRGALTVMLDLNPSALQRGVTAVSAGNHAIAVAFSARLLGATAKVVMPRPILSAWRAAARLAPRSSWSMMWVWLSHACSKFKRRKGVSLCIRSKAL